MKYLRQIIKSTILLSSLTLTLGVSAPRIYAQTKKEKKVDNQMEIRRSTQVFQYVLSGVESLYVDTLNIKDMTSKGINAMLSQLDPYTEYMTDTESKDFEFMTTGIYGGIGAYIQEKDSAVYVQNPMPGSPAEKSGLKRGDKFVIIEGVSVIPGNVSKVSDLLKGPVGTKVKVKVLRLGEEKEREVTLTRESVVVDQVVHRGIYGDNIGYINLISFTNRSASDVRNAFNELNRDRKLKGLILDLRSNGGGVMEDAIKILSMFVPEKTLVVYTEGKLPETTQKYYTTEKPIAPNLPIAVLINGGSASASEIVAGAIQDFDRGVIIGSKSFGKGLVQSTRPLPHNGILKLTIARYYIPSGRCIQQLDYSHRNPDGSVAAIPDSLANTFKTKSGRLVKDGGGIRPDITIEDETLPVSVFNMIRGGYIFDFANKLYLKGKGLPAPKSISDIKITEKDFEDFLTYLENEKFTYGKMSLNALKSLKELIKFEGYKDQSSEAIAALEQSITPDLRKDVIRHKTIIINQIRSSLAVHYFGMSGQYVIGLETDASLKKALEVLSDKDEYRKVLSPQKADKKAEETAA